MAKQGGKGENKSIHLIPPSRFQLLTVPSVTKSNKRQGRKLIRQYIRTSLLLRARQHREECSKNIG
jgi:hypothetical protein